MKSYHKWKKISKIKVLTRKTADFGARNEAHRAKLGGHDVRAEESFPNWGHMRETVTRSQSYGQFTAAHSEIAPIRPNYDFLPILRWSACSRYFSAIIVQSDSSASPDSDPLHHWISINCPQKIWIFFNNTKKKLKISVLDSTEDGSINATFLPLLHIWHWYLFGHEIQKLLAMGVDPLHFM